MLSDAEQRRLAQIEELLITEDPRFARLFNRLRRRRRRLTASSSGILLVCGVAILVLLGSSGLATAIGLLTMLSAVCVLAHGRTWRGRR